MWVIKSESGYIVNIEWSYFKGIGFYWWGKGGVIIKFIWFNIRKEFNWGS